ncbi:hypothetical protein SCUCBS95973_005049 [Sporothrix curviconia]|uniref:ABC transporter domain-containing protein n=1 Tax=Sporothrix curviconia TaxID=1260050 RepID=A0ABP0BTM8_9PEZI
MPGLRRRSALSAALLARPRGKSRVQAGAVGSFDADSEGSGQYFEGETDTTTYTRLSTGYSILQLVGRTLLATAALLWWLRDSSVRGPAAAGELAALFYVLALDLARVVFAGRQPRMRAMLLHHINTLVFVHTCVTFGQLAPSILFFQQRGMCLLDLFSFSLSASASPPALAAAPALSAFASASLGIWFILKFAADCFCLLVAVLSPRQWTAPPVSFGLAQRDQAGPSPEQTCSYFSYFLSYSWMTNIVLTGSRRRLALDDMLPLPAYDEPLIWKERTMAARQRFKTTAMVLAYTLRKNIATMILFAALTAIVEFVAPLALYRLLHHLQEPASSTVRPWLWVVLLFVGPMLRSGVYQQYIFSSTRLMVRIKMCLTQELYEKASRCYERTEAPDTAKGERAGDLDGSTAAADGGADGGAEGIAGARGAAAAAAAADQGGKSENMTTLMAADISAGRLGFSLTSAIGLGQTILTMVRSMNELEAELNSFYRVRKYASLPHEDSKPSAVAASEEERPHAADEPSQAVPQHWPSQGRIEFQNVTVKYALDGPAILQDVSLTVRPGERVGIVGRTGSGKSTLALSLVGFTNVTKGRILVDGIDLATIPRHTLRRRLTVIPQEPVLFGGDIRRTRRRRTS